ncbi:MAG: hypothetical protein IKU88_05040 [Alistipes sp.]|nr:hypothetical protein [Alistipes sp.]
MRNIVKFKSSLRSNHSLFKQLISNAPEWWRRVLQFENAYIDIRKDNTINIYYEGASLAKIVLAKGSVRATCHPKYLYGDNAQAYYKKGIAIYQRCEEELMKLGSEECCLLRNAQLFYSDKEGKEVGNAEKKSEKKLQGEIVCRAKTLYIDSEFAHQYEEDSRHTIRIDLVRIVGNVIQFVELKRIQDNRLLHEESSEVTPEIITQIEEYRNFLKANKDAILAYYKKLIAIKRDLGLPTASADIETLDIDTEPYLEIHNLYTHLNPQREKRIKEIKMMLDGHNVKYEIL